MNNVSIIGRLTSDIELKTTQNGKAVTVFSIAVDRGVKSKDGNKIVDFPRIIAYGKLAEACSKFLIKGSKISVTGFLQTGSYTHKEHKLKIYTTDVVAGKIDFLGNPTENNKGYADSINDELGDYIINDDGEIVPINNN